MSIWIKEVIDSGKILILDNYTKWEVDMFNRMDTRYWRRMDTVSVDGNKITNHSQRDKTITARKII